MCREIQPKIDWAMLDWAIEYLISRLHDSGELEIPEYETGIGYSAIAATVLIASRWRFNTVSGNSYTMYGKKLEVFFDIYERLERAAELAKKQNLVPPDYSGKPSSVSSSQYIRLTGVDGKRLLPIDARFDWCDILESLDKALPELIPTKKKLPTPDPLGRVGEDGKILYLEEINLNKSIDSLYGFLFSD